MKTTNVPTSTVMGMYGATYDINAINNMAVKNGLKPLSPKQIQNMTPQDINRYINAGKRVQSVNSRYIARNSRRFRRNARVPIDANVQQAQMMHTTIRQGIAELGGLGSQGLAQLAISRSVPSSSAVQQNTDGGVTPMNDGSSGGGNTEHGPVYAKKERDEE